MSTLLSSLLMCLLIGSVHMFHTQDNPASVARVCTRWIQMLCNYHQPPLICRGHQYEDASPVTPMCDFPGQRTCGIPPRAIYNGERLNNPYYCYQRG